MSPKLFKVMFTGRIREGFTAEQVRANLRALWPAGERHLHRLFSGRPVIIKKDLDRAMAEKYRDYFRSSGADCRVAAQDPPPGAAAPVDAKAEITCPKCGLAQDPSEECTGCGIYFSKYQQLKQAPTEYAANGGPEEDSLEETATRIQQKNIAFVVMLAGLVLFLTSLYMKNRLPDTDDILPSLYKMPRQSSSQALAFDTRKGGRSYHITPLFDYELWGLVVSYYDSTGWWDITHKFLWKDFINIKDICVLYGFNVRTDAYKEMGFKSGSYTCHAKLKTDRARTQFMGQCLSNNHLLADKRSIQKAVMRAKPGDQIYLKGYLAAYGPTGKPPSRNSSTSRNDTGDGACETIYLTDFKILKTGNPFWRLMFTLSTYILAASIAFLAYTYIRQYRDATRHPGALSISRSTQMLKIIGQLLFLLLLLGLWARIH